MLFVSQYVRDWKYMHKGRNRNILYETTRQEYNFNCIKNIFNDSQSDIKNDQITIFFIQISLSFHIMRSECHVNFNQMIHFILKFSDQN